MWSRLIPLGLLALASAQDPSSSTSNTTTPSPTSTSNSTANLTIITTTITSLVSSGSASPTPTTLVLTLTLNNTATTASSNGTLSNNGTLVNGTATNGTAANATEPWKEGDDWIPFPIAIDPAFGVLGALLILSGIPVAGLGGKNRWSSLAIVSGYSLMLLTLVLILRFGVQPNIQPPSPNPPSTMLRGLYLLACSFSAIIGAGIGIFLFKFAKYWVSAMGGFALGWFILALRPGGTIANVLGRWGLLGGLTVGAFVASLPEKLNPWMMLLGTAWIGATAFMLGVDCYTRAGLKEFYIYNLGFWELFDSLNGAKYPLTQTMSIELGILAAVVIIGAAIQFRILNILQKRIRQLKDEEEARADAAEVQKAAERFKNLETEQAEWEEKYGNSSGGGSGDNHTAPYSPGIDTPSTTPIPRLSWSHPGRASSQLSLLSHKDKDLEKSKGKYDTVAQYSPSLVDLSKASASKRDSGTEELTTPAALSPGLASGSGSGSASHDGNGKEDEDLEAKMKLLDEVRQARMSIRSSLDQLRLGAPTPTLSIRTAARDGRGGSTAAATPTSDRFSETHSRKVSGASSRILDPSSARLAAHPSHLSPQAPTKPISEWDKYVADRQIVTPTLPSPALHSTRESMTLQPHRQSHYASVTAREGGDRRERTASMMERQVSDFGVTPHERYLTNDTYPAGREPLRRTESAHAAMALSRPVSSYELSRPTSSASMRPVDSTSRLSAGPQVLVSTSASPSVGVITGSAYPGYSSGSRSMGPPPPPAAAPGMPRTMTYEELSDRHRKRITALQEPVSREMNEQVQLAKAKQRWEAQKRREAEEMRKREAEKAERAKEREREAMDKGRIVVPPGTGQQGVSSLTHPQEQQVRLSTAALGGSGGRQDNMKSTDQWRRSVAGGLDRMAGQVQGQQPTLAARRMSHGLLAGQQSHGQGMGKRRMSSHLIN